MSLQRLLGTMLASRMAGRGGLGGALGTAAMLGAPIGGKAGLAVLGYLAYRAHRKGQGAKADPAAPGAAARPDAGPADQTLGQRIGGMIDAVAGGGRGQGGGSLAERFAAALGQGAEPAREEAMDDGHALLLIRAMITAAQSDGALSAEERRRICDKLDEAGVEPADRAIVERELDEPKPLDALLAEVRDRETAQQVYLASRAAVSGGSPAQQAYLAYLRQRLELPDEDVEAVERLTG